jgi:hypothetical protein
VLLKYRAAKTCYEQIQQGRQFIAFQKSGAGEESRTLDLNLGKVALYQLSYSRINLPVLPTATYFAASNKKEAVDLFTRGFLRILEREKSLELSTSTLARLRSTN